MATLSGGSVAYGPSSSSRTELASLMPNGPRGFSGGSNAGGEGTFLRDDTIGKTAAPSQRQTRRGNLKDLRWPVVSGARVLTIWVKHPNLGTPAPRIVAKANAAVGLAADQEAVATASTDWQQLTISFTASAAGVIELWREVRSIHQGAYALWDDVAVT